MKVPPQLVGIALLCLSLRPGALAQATTAVPPGAAKKTDQAGVGEASQHAITAHHASASAHAKALRHHALTHPTLRKDVTADHLVQTGAALEAAERHRETFEKTIGDDDKLTAHNEAIRGHHAKAAQHHAALKTETGKAAPNAKLVEEHVTAIHAHVAHAEAENVALKAKRKIREPAEPPVPLKEPAEPPVPLNRTKKKPAEPPVRLKEPAEPPVRLKEPAEPPVLLNRTKREPAEPPVLWK